jgi:hypothetical protein
MLVSAIQGNWACPAQFGRENSLPIQEAVDENVVSPPLEVATLNETTKSKEQALPIPGAERDAREAWALVLDELRMLMTRATFDTWLGGTRVLSVEDATMVVQVRDPYAAEWLVARWLTPIRRTLAGIVGQPLDIEFRVLGEGPSGP